MMNTSQNTSVNKLIRPQLELINRRTIRYPLAIAEKDYFLALAIRLIYSSALKNKLIFKGGTALHHTYLSQKRFSEDLDFTGIEPAITAAEIGSILESDGLFKVNKVYQSEFTIKIERLQYQGLLGQPGNIKVEIDHHQNVVLPGVDTIYRNVWGVTSSVIVMDKREICAEKIRAVSQRARYRDFYDLWFLLNDFEINLEEVLHILRQKEIRTPILSNSISNNWSVAREQKGRDLGSIYCSEEVKNQDIEQLIQLLRFEDITIQE